MGGGSRGEKLELAARYAESRDQDFLKASPISTDKNLL